MPIHPNQDRLKTTSSSGTVQEATIENICPGWDKVLCLGYFPEDSDSCRPCESKSEAWLSAEFGANKGICLCSPEPVKAFKEHSEAIASLVIFLGGGYLILRRIFAKSGRKK